MKNTIYIYIVAFISALFFTVEIEAKDKFVVVIDAGHGGNDPGAVANRLQEKNINLDIALKLGKMIQRNCSDTKVIYTRSKDVFVRTHRNWKQSQSRPFYFHTYQFCKKYFCKRYGNLYIRFGTDRHKYGGR